MWAGTRRNVPVKHVTAGCLGTRAGDRSLKCLVDFSGTSSFLKEGGQTEKKKKKKDMKLVSEHGRVQADEGPSNFILCSNVGKVF